MIRTSASLSFEANARGEERRTLFWFLYLDKHLIRLVVVCDRKIFTPGKS